MLWLLALVVTLILLVPGLELLRWLVVDVMRLYDKFTLADGCLVLLVFLQLVLIFHLSAILRAWHQEEEEEVGLPATVRRSPRPSLNGEPEQRSSPRSSPRQPSRRATSSTGSRRTRSSGRRQSRS